jgi:hypothetical protein
VNGPPTKQGDSLPRDWFQIVWDGMTQGEQDRVKTKAQWEHMSLRAVLQDWPTLAPPGVWHLIPKPERQP